MPVLQLHALPRLRQHTIAFALLAPGAVLANAPQDLTALPFEQLLSMEVYSASKFVQKSSRAPSSVTVITAADIRAYGWRTLADVARSVRGLYVSYDRNYSYLGERGFLRPGDYNTRFLLLVDGNRINDAVYDQAPLGGEFPLELDLVERIEFVPGPGSSIYGSNAFFGVINVITKKVSSLDGVRGALEAGQSGARKASASIGWGSPGGARFLIAASRYRSAGQDLYYPEFDTPEQNHGVAQGLDYERGQRVYASAVQGPVRVSLMHGERIKGIPTASFGMLFNDPRPRTTDRQTYLNLAWRNRVAQAEDLTARLFWGRYDSFGDYAGGEAPATLNHDGSAARWWGSELKLVSTRFAGHTAVAGLDYQRDYRLQQYGFAVEPYTQYLDEQRSGQRLGVYLQDEAALTDELLFSVGARYDHHGGAHGVVSPRVALIVALAPGTTLKAIYGSAFRAPNSYETYYAFEGEGGQRANPDLHKESIDSTELALVHELGQRTRVTATLFRNIVTGLITQLTDPATGTTRFENAVRARARGVEFEYERNWASGAILRTSYSWTRATQSGETGGTAGAQVNAPAHLAKLNAALPLGASGWRAALEAQYVGRRRTLTGETGAFWLANANLFTAHLGAGTEASIGVYNLFDRRYADPGSTEHTQAAIGQDGRSVRVRIGHAF